MNEIRKQVIKDFVQYARLNQYALKEKLGRELKEFGYKTKNKSGYLFARGNLPIMLVAHLDTVHKQLPIDIWFSEENRKIMSTNGIGGDDRCGVYSIMNILKTTQFRPNILFVEDEEIGGIGSKLFTKNYAKNTIDIKYIIELDRANAKDMVFYDCDNVDFIKYVGKFGFVENYGSFTDIVILCPHFNIAGVNLSVGYYKQHTNEEYIVIDEMISTIKKVKNMLEDVDNINKFEYVEKKYNYNWLSYKHSSYDYSKYDYDKYKNYGIEDYREEFYDEVCAYCSNNLSYTYDEYDNPICKECLEDYGFNLCETCGCATHNKTNCIVCEQEQEDNLNATGLNSPNLKS